MRGLVLFSALLMLGATYPLHRRVLQRNLPATAEVVATPEDTTKALVFDNNADRLTLSAGLPTSHLMSMKCWVYLPAPRPNAALWFGLSGATTATEYNQWGVIVDGATHFFFHGPDAWSYAAATPIAADTWTYVFMILDGSGATIYSKPLGGETLFKERLDHTVEAFTPVSLKIATDRNGANNIAGAMRGCAVWDHTVTWTDQQVDDESAQFAPVRETGLYSYWRLATVAGKLVDLSGNGHTLDNPGGAGSWTEAAAPEGIPETQ